MQSVGILFLKFLLIKNPGPNGFHGNAAAPLVQSHSRGIGDVHSTGSHDENDIHQATRAFLFAPRLAALIFYCAAGRVCRGRDR